MMPDEKPGITIDKKVNIANIISILGTFAILIAFGVTLKTRVEYLECQVKENNSLKIEMTQVKTEVRGIREDLQEIKSDVKAAVRSRQ